MSEKYKKVIKIIVIICLVILLLDGLICVYSKNFRKEEKTYFDSINSFEKLSNTYIGVGSNNNNENSYEKAKLTKYDINQEEIWEKLYNKGYNSSFFSVKADEDNFIAVGNFESTKKEHKDGVRSALIVKYDSDGEVLYEKKFQVLGNSKFTNVLVVDDGYIVVGQSIYENMTLGLSNDGGAFIIKYDKELKEVWKSNYGGSKSGIYNDLYIKDNYIYAVGKDSARVGIISKYDMNGQRISTINYEYTDTLGFTSIVGINNNLYVIGSKKVKEDKNDYDTDALIVKYNLDCNKIDEKIYTGKGMERFNKAIVDSNNNIVVVGQTGIYNKSKSTKDENIFSYDGIFAKYDEDLNQLELEQYGDEKDDYFTDIKVTDKNYIVSGYSTYDANNYLSKFIVYSKTGNLIGAK